MKRIDFEKFGFDFKTVFDPRDYLHFYQQSISEEVTERQVSFFISHLDMEKPSRVLDLACGHGRHSIPLAKMGHNVTGIDITPGFLKIARKQAVQAGVKIDFREGDMRKIRFANLFDRALLIFTSFGYFTDEQNFAVLKNVARALRRNGLFCFDTFNRDMFMKLHSTWNVIERDSDIMINRIQFDSITGKLCVNRIAIRGGKRKDMRFFVRLYNYNELKELLQKAGMKIQAAYGDWQGTPFSSQSGRIIIVAEKI